MLPLCNCFRFPPSGLSSRRLWLSAMLSFLIPHSFLCVLLFVSFDILIINLNRLKVKCDYLHIKSLIVWQFPAGGTSDRQAEPVTGRRNQWPDPVAAGRKIITYVVCCCQEENYTNFIVNFSPIYTKKKIIFSVLYKKQIIFLYIFFIRFWVYLNTKNHYFLLLLHKKQL